VVSLRCAHCANVLTNRRKAATSASVYTYNFNLCLVTGLKIVIGNRIVQRILLHVHMYRVFKGKAAIGLCDVLMKTLHLKHSAECSENVAKKM
jgi:hypothetical protein